MTFDARGNLTRTDYPDGTSTTATYDSEGRMVASTDAAGSTSYTLYDALGRATESILPDETMPAAILTEVAAIAAAPELADNPRNITIYDADGRVTASTDANGNTTTFGYDDAGRRSSVTDALGNTMSYTFDAAGRQTTATDARGATTTFIYDPAGRLTRTNLPDGNHTLTGYDALGRRTSVTDAEGNVTLFGYDAQSRMVKVTDALGGETRYGYDSRGLQTSQTDALGRTTAYEYDSPGRRTARILPAGEREEMTYDSLGRLTALKDFNGSVITRSYDPDNDRLLAVVAPANHPSLTLSHAPARYEFGYDVLGRRTAAVVKNATGTAISSESYSYDVRSQLTGYAGPTGSIGYGYDLAGNLAGAVSGTPGGYDVSYDYDALNRISQVYRGQEGIDPTASPLAGYNYDANGNLNGTGYANGVQHAYTYSAVNRLLNLGVTRSAGVPPTPLHTYAYTLNKNGHRTLITELSGRTIANGYDALLRLTSETISGATTSPNGALGYIYDAVGNRTSRTSSGAIAGIVPSQTQSFTTNDRLTSDTYDSNGNTTQSQTPLITDHSALVTSSDVYSFDNKLIRRTRADGLKIDITYNADGHRLYKHITQGGLTQRTTHYLTDSNNPTGYAQVIEEKDPLAAAGEELSKVHLYGHDLVSTEQRDSSLGSSVLSSLVFYSYDGLGSVRSITDQTGTVQETYDYDAYGTLIAFSKRNAEGALELLNPENFQLATSSFLFTGEQWDDDLGMYFLRARFLNTNTGRFHSQDSYEGRNGEPQTLHKYLYVHGNPVMSLDPSGNVSLSEVSSTIGTLLSFSSRVISTYQTASKTIQTAQTIVGLYQMTMGGGLAQMLNGWKSILTAWGPLPPRSETAQLVTDGFWADALSAFQSGSSFIFSGVLKNWGSTIARRFALSDVKKFSWVMYMPTPGPEGLDKFIPNPKLMLKSPLKIAGAPVEFEFGHGNNRGRVFGAGIRVGKGQSSQIFRLDYHNPHNKSGSKGDAAFRIIDKGPFHVHIKRP